MKAEGTGKIFNHGWTRMDTDVEPPENFQRAAASCRQAAGDGKFLVWPSRFLFAYFAWFAVKNKTRNTRNTRTERAIGAAYL
jgi:hypothetical protein